MSDICWADNETGMRWILTHSVMVLILENVSTASPATGGKECRKGKRGWDHRTLRYTRNLFGDTVFWRKQYECTLSSFSGNIYSSRMSMDPSVRQVSCNEWSGAVRTGNRRLSSLLYTFFPTGNSNDGGAQTATAWSLAWSLLKKATYV